MKKNRTFRNSILLYILLHFGNMNAQETVSFDTNQLAAGTIENGAASLNTCWLLDSDIERPKNISNDTRFAELQSGSLRYPYGHLADNYLWDTPPYGGKLEPKVAAMSEAPGTWSWATNADGSIKKSMDFDEFMAICQRQNIKPLVVINILSYKYSGGPTYEELKTAAVEWVKYAKNKGYQVAYWQLGNEVDHHPKYMDKMQYANLYRDFVSAMKAENPEIKCGTGILSNTNWLTDILNQSPSLVDFASVHQYLFSKPFTNYSEWVTHKGDNLNRNVNDMQNVINQSSKPNLPMLITESNAYGNWSGESSPALYKGLAWFDMLFTQQSFPNVVYTYMWNSHSPWKGETGDGGETNALFNDQDNNITAMGWPLKILNTTAEEKYMIPDNKVHGTTYSYGSYSPSSKNMTLYLINKDVSSVSITVDINNYIINSNYERWVFAGNDQYDTKPSFSQQGTITINPDGFTTILPPYSLVVLKLKNK